MADLAEIANAAYEKDIALTQSLDRHGWTYNLGWDVGSNYAFAATRTFGNEKQMVISFRGTDSLADWLTNGSDFGFTLAYKDVRPIVENAFKYATVTGVDKIFLTGHSLGGAMAQAAFLDIFTPQNLDIWKWPSSSHLDSSDRIGDNDSLLIDDGELTPDDIASIKDNLILATFGAPGINFDPDHSALLFTGISLLNDSIQNNIINGTYADRIFQFEHTATDHIDDPFAEFGGEIGTRVEIALSNSIAEGYITNASLGPADLHAMYAYQESLLRATAGLPLIENNGNIVGNNDHDVLVAQSGQTLNGGTGNDIYVVDATDDNVTISPSSGQDRLILLNVWNSGWVNVRAEVSGEDLRLSWAWQQSTHDLTVKNWYSASSNYQLAQISLMSESNGPWLHDTDYLNTYGAVLTPTVFGAPWFPTDVREINASGTPYIRDDLIYGSQEADIVKGYRGKDTLYGQNGNDVLFGETNTEESRWLGEDDHLYGGDGNDTLYGGGGNDYLNGGQHEDHLYGGYGDDILDGGPEVDHLEGEEGNDRLIARDDGEYLAGGTGSDTYVIYGEGEYDLHETGLWENDLLVLALDSLSLAETRFEILDDRLIVRAIDSSQRERIQIDLHDFLTNPVEALVVSNDQERDEYTLQYVWNLVASGDDTAEAARTHYDTPHPWGYGRDNEVVVNGGPGNDFRLLVKSSG